MPEIDHQNFGIAGLFGSAAVAFLVLSLIYWIWGLFERPPAAETEDAESAPSPKSVSPGWFAFGAAFWALMFACGVILRRHH
ncbi:hypothetical protein [Dongia rigui]|uniref:Uncharacterized protein n=1 Tax=Dongia rigui TaxID=940149 RepID=A0ABU5DU14_9PROT|nr:hypothetical protein [Dongia rigui]MDY0870439.1 hypothetical protein [Dongia rigui]